MDLLLTNSRDDMKRIEDSKDRLVDGSYIWILSHSDFID
jgi:hypothetical protein